MMIKVSGGFLDFDDVVEVERQVRLFENIDETWGDFSYSFTIQKTTNNTRLLGNPQPDNINKPVYQKIDAIVLNDQGIEVYKGYIRIERIGIVYECSFFSGNNNWFGLLSDQISALNFSNFDTDLTQIVLQNAIFNTEGIVFPLLDNGALDTRGNAQLRVEDFVAGIYVKTVFEKIFRDKGIKVQGELFNDVNYQNAITVSNGKSQNDIDAASSYAQNTTGTARPVENDFYKMEFQNDSDYPFYDGSLDAFDLPNSMWVAPFKTEIEIEVTATFAIASPSYSQRIYLYINGVFTFVDVGLEAGVGGLYNAAYVGSESSMTMRRRFVVEEGDTIEVYTQWQQSGGSTQNDIVSGTVKITPVFIYKVFGNAIVPPWTQQQYVSNILRVFNCITTYEASNKTLTINLFDNIKSKDPVDISEYIESVDVDYTEVISDYGKKNYLSYTEVSVDDDFRETRFPYSKGVINVDNDFIADEADILESEFANPVSYINTIFDMSIERTNLITLERSGISTEATGVTDSGGVRARFAIPNNVFLISDLVRIEDSTNPEYNGDWKIYTIGDGYVEFTGLQFSSNATARLTKLNFKYTESDDVFLMRHVPLYPVTNFSGLPSIRLENTSLETMSFAFFHLLNTGRQVNRDFRFSFSFTSGDSDLQYQISLIDQYFTLLIRILNDPVKLTCSAHLPKYVYDRIDFLRPVTIKTLETTNQYLVNRITGYKESYLPCTIELIKLP